MSPVRPSSVRYLNDIPVPMRDGVRLSADVYLPEGSTALVSVGQTAVAGETILSDLRPNDGGPTFRTH